MGRKKQNMDASTHMFEFEEDQEDFEINMNQRDCEIDQIHNGEIQILESHDLRNFKSLHLLAKLEMNIVHITEICIHIFDTQER